jgi:hypothetical protein
MSQQVNSDGLAPDLGALWRHRALVVTALYAFVALVGALYYALLLGDFGVNPFHYWEASDFLLATFREPVSMGFGAIAILLYLSLVRGREVNDYLYGRIPWVRRLLRYDRWRDSPWMSPRWGVGASTAFVLVWFVFVMGAVATGAGNDARRGEGRAVRYALSDGALIEAQLLTTTNRFAFLVVPGAGHRGARLHAVPFEAIVELELCGARRGLYHWLLGKREGCSGDAAIAPAATAVPVAPVAATTAPPSAAPAARP